MCYHYEVEDTPVAGKYRYPDRPTSFKPGIQNGFTHPYVPVVIAQKPDEPQFYQWGLMPHWAKDSKLQKNTLNARIETIHEKPSFRLYTDNRCLILCTGFFEWKWLDIKGKQKQKHRIWQKGTELFSIAGLYSHWLDKSTGEIIPTFTLLTREAQGIMREIHNSKLRMPAVLLPEEETAWLYGDIEIPTPPILEAIEV